MKKLAVIFTILAASLLFLTACKGSKEIQGTWNETNPAEVSSEIVVHEKTIEIDGQKSTYGQNGVGITNGVKYHTLSLDGEDGYLTFVFPTKSKDIAFLIQAEDLDEPMKGTIVLALDREVVPSYSEYIEQYNK